MNTNHNLEDKQPNEIDLEKKSPGRPRLEDTPLRRYWRKLKAKQRERSKAK